MSDIDINNIKKLDGGLLLVFRELMRQRQTTAAARRLGLSQSAVSHALTRLRDIFGDPLLTRRSRGLEPTQRALELVPRIDALIDLTSATVHRRGAFDPAGSERRFNIASMDFVAAIIGPPLLRRLARSAPRVSFSVDLLLENRALDALTRGEVDMAIGRFFAPNPRLSVETLYNDRYCVVARRGHPELKGRISEAAYRTMGHVFSGSSSTHSSSERVPDGRQIATHALVPTWLSALLIVSSTDSIATCPRRLAECYARKLGLQILKTPFAMDDIRIYLARRAGASDQAIDWFHGQIKAAVGG
jgi:DNA-binding transcriptional LysR family regulator